MGKGRGNTGASPRRKFKKSFKKDLGFGTFANNIKQRLKADRIKKTDIEETLNKEI